MAMARMDLCTTATTEVTKLSIINRVVAVLTLANARGLVTRGRSISNIGIISQIITRAHTGDLFANRNKQKPHRIKCAAESYTQMTNGRHRR